MEKRLIQLFEQQNQKFDERFVQQDKKFDERFDALTQRFEQQNQKFDERFDALTQRFEQQNQKFDERFDALTQRFEQQNQKFDERFVQQDKKFEAIDAKLESIILILLEHEDRFKRIEDIMATKEDIRRLTTILEDTLGLYKKQEEEMLFMGQRVGRNENDIKRIKAVVKLA